MQTNFSLEIFREETERIAADVFRTMLQMDVAPKGVFAGAVHPPLVAAVQFGGIWKGALSIECSSDQAKEFASRLLSAHMSELKEDDVTDAFGELANMIGGNLKAVLPVRVDISVPSVVKGAEYLFRFREAECYRLSFACEAGEFQIGLWSLFSPN